MKTCIAIACACLALLGCKQPADDDKAVRKAQDRQAVKAVIQAGPQTVSWDTPQGTVIEITIPRATLGGNFVESKRCIVWRDAVAKTASLFCDREEIERPDLSPDTPTHEQ